jgi:hypothetical protein
MTSKVKIVTCVTCGQKYERKLFNGFLCPCIDCDPACPNCGVKDGSENQE